jgi:uncharacterized protein YgbK (DUF1537 family)
MPSAAFPENPILGVIADDFTGASDAANTISKAGIPTILTINDCPPSLPDGFGAVVVAQKTRSIPAADAVSQSVAALDGLRRLGAGQIIFKHCSTFDSTPEGNIGPVTEALAERLGFTGPVVVCPAFPDARRTVYQGHLFVGDRLLSESGMENHPLNPMTDPDIRRWLARQSRGTVGHLPLATVRAGTAAIHARLAEEAGAGRRLVIADAVDNGDLKTLGEALVDDPLVSSGSGVAMGLARVHAGRMEEPRAGAASSPVDGPGLVLAGSCSAATLAQVARYAASHPALPIDAESVIDGLTTERQALDFISANRGDTPLVYSSVEAEELHRIQARRGTEAVASALEHFFGAVASRAVAGGVRRLVVAGGETAGAVVGALGLTTLAIGPEVAVGVPAMTALDRPLAVVLKSGNFGGPDFFAAALAALGRP